MAAGRYNNTESYLENEKFIRLTNNRKYIKVALRHLMMHYKGEQLLHKKQIEFIVKNCIVEYRVIGFEVNFEVI